MDGSTITGRQFNGSAITRSFPAIASAGGAR